MRSVARGREERGDQEPRVEDQERSQKDKETQDSVRPKWLGYIGIRAEEGKGREAGEV